MYSVMLVDDEKLTLEYLKMTIPQQDPDWQVTALCSDGIEALEWLSSHQSDLIITDIKMPEMTGLELSRKVKELYPNQKIMILSGYDEFKFAQQAIQYGVRDYLLKPISLGDLKKSLSQIKTLLEREKMEMQAYSRLLKMSENGKKQLAARFIKAVIDRAEPETRSLYPLIHRMKISLLEGPARLLLFDLDMDLLLENGLPIQDISLYQYMVFQIVLEISENQKDPVWTLLDRFNHIVVLLSADTPDAALQKSRDIYHIVSEVLQNQMKLSLSSVVSEPFTDIFEADKAYVQSIAVLNAKVFLKPGNFYSTADYKPEIRQKSASLHQAVSSLWVAISDRNVVNQELALSSLLAFMPQYTRPELLRFGLHWILDIFSKWDREFPERKKICGQAVLKLAEADTDNTRETALKLMKENPQMKIYDIVEKVGYVSVKHFSYVFRQTKGMSPSEYQSRLTT